MYVPIPELDLQFMDFAILAVLLAALYGLSAMEFVLASRGGRNLSEVEEIDLHKAITWAFLGIVATLIAGVLADSSELATLKFPLVLVPMLFITRWAVFHFRRSRLVKIDLLQEELDNQYKKEILEVVEASEVQAVSATQVYEKCTRALNYSQIFNILHYSFGNSVFSVSLDDFAEKMIFTQNKATNLLESLVAEGELGKDGDHYFSTRKVLQADTVT